MQELLFGEAALPLMLKETMSILPLGTSILPHYAYVSVERDRFIELDLLKQTSVLNQTATPIQS